MATPEARSTTVSPEMDIDHAIFKDYYEYFVREEGLRKFYQTVAAGRYGGISLRRKVGVYSDRLAQIGLDDVAEEVEAITEEAAQRYQTTHQHLLDDIEKVAAPVLASALQASSLQDKERSLLLKRGVQATELLEEVEHHRLWLVPSDEGQYDSQRQQAAHNEIKVRYEDIRSELEVQAEEQQVAL